MWGTQLAQQVEYVTLDLGQGHEFKPIGHRAYSEEEKKIQQSAG